MLGMFSRLNSKQQETDPAQETVVELLVELLPQLTPVSALIRTNLPDGATLRDLCQQILDGEGPIWDQVSGYLQKVVDAQ